MLQPAATKVGEALESFDEVVVTQRVTETEVPGRAEGLARARRRS